VNGSEPEVTPVRSALYHGDRAGALALIEGGAEPNVFDVAAARNADGRDARSFAADNGHAAIAARIQASEGIG
jgi:hypothetical protein